ncbi:MAG TPA: hypothetical protein VM884_07210 [Flavisolibacter sp.]|jgi:hypothetical protein|nr:hypothetical protein [Flavisolibacter sp.]
MYLPNQAKPVQRKRSYSIGKASQPAINPSDDDMEGDDEGDDEGGMEDMDGEGDSDD